jgi:hypothetical protein
MSRRLYLHIGTPKSGTSYLQSVLRDNKRAFRDLGLLFPFDSLRSYFALYECAVHGFDGPDARESAVKRFDAFCSRVAAWQSDAIASHEALVRLHPEQVQGLVDRLTELDVELQVVLTVRDLARQIPSSWQQDVKVGSTVGFGDYLATIQHDRTSLFWREQDVVRALGAWVPAVGADHVTVVTIPPSGSPPDLLWRRFAAAIEIDPDGIALSETHRSNRSMGAVDVEIFRRINEVVARREEEQGEYLVHHRKRRSSLGRRISSKVGDAAPASYSPDLHGWVQAESAAIVDAVKASGVRVVGDLDDLTPGSQPPAGADPDAVDDQQIAARAPEIIEDVFLDYEGLVFSLRRELAESHRASRRLRGRVNELREQLVQARAPRTFGERMRARVGRLRRRSRS